MEQWKQKWAFFALLVALALGNTSCKPKRTTPSSPQETPTVTEENTFHLPAESLPSLSSDRKPSDQYLLRDSSLLNYYLVDESGIHFFAEAGERKHSEAEFIIYPNEYAQTSKMFKVFPLDSMIRYCREKGQQAWEKRFEQITSPPPFYYQAQKVAPLQGLRVAIDPGHMAGTMEVAEIEGKYMKMYANPKEGRPPIQFNEANLTLATAHLVRQKLQAMGATVLMTRTQPGVGVSGVSWEEWRQSSAFEDSVKRLRKEGELSWKKARWWRKSAEEKDIMKRFFTPRDLRARARMINAFQPHLTLIIHFNVDAPNWELRDEEGFFRPTDQNYLMAFTPGSFMAGELATLEDRVAFLRQLLTDDVAASVKLCHAFVEASVRQTGVPIVDTAYPLSYLQRASILTEWPGVYARNLSLTRLIGGPLCYGESLNQDHREESLLLNKRDLEIEGIHTSSRLKNVAEAYVQAVLEFVKD